MCGPYRTLVWADFGCALGMFMNEKDAICSADEDAGKLYLSGGMDTTSAIEEDWSTGALAENPIICLY